jgi:choline dehydrogenase-like flavoprotein
MPVANTGAEGIIQKNTVRAKAPHEMTIICTTQLDPNARLEADLCVVGAGAAGITLAGAFEGSSRTVCLVESGGFHVDDALQSLCELDVVGYPVQERFMSRARYFGGTCNLWAGRSMQLTPFDLERRDWIAESGWPIAYDDLEEHYAKAAQLLKLPSHRHFEADTLAQRMSRAERALFENDDLRPNVSLWARRPLRFGAAYRAAFAKSRSVLVCCQASVTEVLLNRDGDAVEEVMIATLAGKRMTVRARQFVLACGALENARLLLVSRGVQSAGIGNAFDVVGRFFMDHPRIVLGRVLLAGKQAFPLMLGLALRDGMGQVGVGLSETVQRREHLLNNYVSFERPWSPHTARAYQSLVRSAKVLLRKGYSGSRLTPPSRGLARVPDSIFLFAPRELMPHSMYRMIRAARDRFGRNVNALTVVNYCEQPPNRESRVYLSERRDRLGMNRLVLDWKIGPDETRTLRRLHQLIDRNLRKHHVGSLDSDWDHAPLGFSDAAHHAGTTRMSDNPRRGVVDGDCRVHGVRNLHIAGSSVFPTVGHANPTWTIVALALRLSERLRKLH